jgi:hypothetical protein
MNAWLELDSMLKAALCFVLGLVALSLGGAFLLVLLGFAPGTGGAMSFDVSRIRADFPILSRQVNNKPLVYLDNGASAQKPQVVIDAVTQAYSSEYANVHRGLHYLSNLATDKYEAVRGKLARFLNAASEEHIVLNSGTYRRHQFGGLWLGNAAL